MKNEIIEIAKMREQGQCGRWRITFENGEFAIIRRPAKENIFTLATRISQMATVTRLTVSMLNIRESQD